MSAMSSNYNSYSLYSMKGPRRGKVKLTNRISVDLSKSRTNDSLSASKERRLSDKWCNSLKNYQKGPVRKYQGVNSPSRTTKSIKVDITKNRKAVSRTNRYREKEEKTNLNQDLKLPKGSKPLVKSKKNSKTSLNQKYANVKSRYKESKQKTNRLSGSMIWSHKEFVRSVQKREVSNSFRSP